MRAKSDKSGNSGNTGRINGAKDHNSDDGFVVYYRCVEKI